MKTSVLDGILDILEVLHVGGDHVEISLQGLPHDAHRRDFAAERFTVDNILLGEDVDNLFAGLEQGVVLLVGEAVDISLLDEAVVGGNHDAAVARTRLDVLSGDADPHHVVVKSSLVGGFADGTADRLGGIGDALDNAVFHALGVGFTEAQDFHFP